MYMQAAYPFYVFLGKLFKGVIEQFPPLALGLLFGDIISLLHLSSALSVVAPRPLLLPLLRGIIFCSLQCKKSHVKQGCVILGMSYLQDCMCLVRTRSLWIQSFTHLYLESMGQQTIDTSMMQRAHHVMSRWPQIHAILDGKRYDSLS